LAGRQGRCVDVAAPVKSIAPLLVGSACYGVHFLPDVRSDDDEKRLGQVHLIGGRIELDANAPFDVIRETLLHEVIHAVDYQTRCELTEDQVFRLSMGLATVLARNPHLVSLFLSNDPWRINDPLAAAAD
jgi:hypothetical protein